MESISRRVISPCLCEISSHTSTWTRLQMEGTDHNDTRSRRLGFGGYLGDFTSLITPSLYDSWRVSMEGSSTVDSSESDINLGSLRRDRSRESRTPICQGDRSGEGAVGPGFCRRGSFWSSLLRGVSLPLSSHSRLGPFRVEIATGLTAFGVGRYG